MPQARYQAAHARWHQVPPGCTAQRVRLCLLIGKGSKSAAPFTRAALRGAHSYSHIGSPRAALGSGDNTGLQEGARKAHGASCLITNPRREDDAPHGDRSGAGPGMRRALGRRSAALAPAAHNLLHEPIGCRAINKRVPDCGPAGCHRCLQRPVSRCSRTGGAPGFAACCRHLPPAACRLPPTAHASTLLPSSHSDCRCGTVVVDLQGAYLTGALRLTDCVHLQLPAGVTLLAGDKVSGGGLLSITTGREINPARVNRARGVMQ